MPWKIDHTKEPTVDEVYWCPVQLFDRTYAEWIYRAIDIEYLHGGISDAELACAPARVDEFYKDCIKARDRFDAQLQATESFLFNKKGNTL